MSKIGRRRLLVSGFVLEGFSTLAFGFLYYIEDRWLFMSLAILIRALQGFGSAAASTSAFSILAAVYQGEDFTTAIGCIETALGVGMMVGPPLGGALYDLGGFVCPFICMSALFLAFSPIVYRLLPVDLKYDEKKAQVKLWSVLSCFEVLLPAGSIMFAMSAAAFTDPTLAEHLDDFELSKVAVGAVFMVITLTYATTAPFVGRLVRRCGGMQTMVVGLFVSALSYMLLGPSPLLPFIPKTLWLVCIALGVMGLGCCIVFVPAMPHMTQATTHLGPAASDVVAGVVTSAFALGNIIGPVMGSGLVAGLGFATASTTFAAILALYGVVLLIAVPLLASRQGDLHGGVNSLHGDPLCPSKSSLSDHTMPLLADCTEH
eukprot:GILJ01009672.1.p1 GENE.GILJ01009672.1~~GILJ01009672.1.p1  ORF type:complete len:375 (+),score=49.46 GILJ01009672.1:525-1649(+)